MSTHFTACDLVRLAPPLDLNFLHPWMIRSQKFFTCSFIRDKSRDTIRTGYVGFLHSFTILVENVDNMRDTFEDR